MVCKIKKSDSSGLYQIVTLKSKLSGLKAFNKIQSKSNKILKLQVVKHGMEFKIFLWNSLTFYGV